MMINFISYCDGKHSLFEIAEMIKEPFWELIPIMEKLIDENLLTVEKSD